MEVLKQLNPADTLGEVGISLYREMNMRVDELKDEPGYENKIVKMFRVYNIDAAVIVQLTFSNICTSAASGADLVPLAQSIGKSIGYYYKIDNFNNVKAVNLGNFVLDVYLRKDLIQRKLIKQMSGNKFKTVWKVYAVKRSSLSKLVKEFPKYESDNLPLSKQSPDWEGGIQKEGLQINKAIRGKYVSDDTLKKFSKSTLVMDVLNKKQKVKFRICQDTFKVFEQCLKLKSKVFDFNNPEIGLGEESVKSKKMQAQMLLEIGKLRPEFYQKYFCDFRGRIYPSSKFLNEIGSDMAKGLIQFAEGKPLGETGISRLFQHISNSWGNDKVSVADRVKFVDDNSVEFYGYGADPLVNTGWMKADNPWSMLSACKELVELEKFHTAGGKIEDFVSHTICYYDGTNNGVQWSMALMKDDTNAHLVNLKSKLDGTIGDFYSHIAKEVSKKISEVTITEEAQFNYDNIVVPLQKLRIKLRAHQEDLKATKDKEVKELIISKIKTIKTELSGIQAAKSAEIKTTNELYWSKYFSKAEASKIRKLVKTPCMVYAYSGTVYGFDEQIKDYIKTSSDEFLKNANNKAVFYLAKLIYETISEQFTKLVEFRNYTSKAVKGYMKTNKENFKMEVPISSFPFANNYMGVKSKRATLYFYTKDDEGNLEYKLHELDVDEDLEKIDPKKASDGISPNLVHSLDALHVHLVVNECDFDTVTVHDSYGAHAANGCMLNAVIRSKFVEVLEADPLGKFQEATQHEGKPETGNLDYNEILKADYCFS